MEAPILALIPSGVKAGKVYSILPNNGTGDFTFTRASEGTRIDENGLIDVQGSGIPRLGWGDGDCPSLLLEPQRTNELIYSEDFTNSVWSLLSGGTGLNPVVTANYSLSPSGAQDANRIIFNKQTGTSGNDFSIINQIVSNVGQGVSSVYMKSNTSQNYLISIDKTGFTNNVTVTPEWQRFEYSESSNDRLRLSLRGNLSSSYADVSVWGAQMEQGNYASSYIGTKSAAVTRLKDFINGAGSGDLFNSLESTFFVEMASFLNAQTNSNGIELAGVGGLNRITLQYETTNNLMRCDVRVSGTPILIFSSAFDVTNFNKMAITYKLNEVKFYVNGNLIGTNTSVNLFAPNTLTEVRSTIADISNGAFNLQAKIKDLRVYNRVLTEAEAIELTTL